MRGHSPSCFLSSRDENDGAQVLSGFRMWVMELTSADEEIRGSRPGMGNAL